MSLLMNSQTACARMIFKYLKNLCHKKQEIREIYADQLKSFYFCIVVFREKQMIKNSKCNLVQLTIVIPCLSDQFPKRSSFISIPKYYSLSQTLPCHPQIYSANAHSSSDTESTYRLRVPLASNPLVLGCSGPPSTFCIDICLLGNHKI